MAAADNMADDYQDFVLPDIEPGEGEALPIPPKPELEVERSILGAIMADPYEAVPLAMEANLQPDDFFTPAHGFIYETLLELYNDGKGIDLILLSNRLEQKKLIKQVGGRSYVSEIHDQYGIPGNVGHYASLIIDRSTLRRLLKVSSEIAELVRAEIQTVPEILDESEALVFKIKDSRVASRLVHVSEPMERVYRNIIGVRNVVGGITGIPTGYTFLDQKTGGFQKTDLIVIGGRPGMGKTSLALNFALNAAVPMMRESRKDFPPHTVAIFSMEMGNDQVLQRLLCQLGHHDLVQLRTGRITDDDVQRLTANASLLRHSDIYVDDTAALRPLELRAKARRLQSSLARNKKTLGLVLVDYLQLMRPNGRHNNREQEIREISGSLKALAKELEVPVITLSQLKRSDELEPSLSDLRESGSIEQDADLVFFIVRPEMIKKDDPTLKGKAELRINKHRNGPLGLIHLRYLHPCTSFVPGTNVDIVDDL
ncbi:MAG: replicative DNA helicase [Deltaproteobacteria bacterium]|jgi:replicative DNA helicase|nr:replicative DNA helicase [Deltaproteobacteria bacterium]